MAESKYANTTLHFSTTDRDRCVVILRKTDGDDKIVFSRRVATISITIENIEVCKDLFGEEARATLLQLFRHDEETRDAIVSAVLALNDNPKT